jgi:bifunctional non-homologous end joining protein LigD
VPPPRFLPLPLKKIREPFDDPEWLFELKYDGFRALAFVHRDRVELASRNQRRFKRFAQLERELRSVLKMRSAVLDGEVVVLDETGRPKFKALFSSRSAPVFVAFDLLELEGKDVRELELVRRKAMLRKALPANGGPVMYADHVDGTGRQFFDAVCEEGLEGIVGKWKKGPYREPTSWVKVKNPEYAEEMERFQKMKR